MYVPTVGGIQILFRPYRPMRSSQTGPLQATTSLLSFLLQPPIHSTRMMQHGYQGKKPQYKRFIHCYSGVQDSMQFWHFSYAVYH